MGSWIIKDADGNIINPHLIGSEEFVKANFDHYEAFPEEEETPMTPEEEAREWRDGQLIALDSMVTVTDHPKHAAYIAFRQELRDWPSTDDFPDTKPTLES